MNDATPSSTEAKTANPPAGGARHGAGGRTPDGPAGKTPGTAEQTSTRLESREERTHRLSVGALVLLVGLVLVFLTTSVEGTARFALSNAFDEVQLPTVSLPGLPVVVVCAVLCVLAGLGFLIGRLSRRFRYLAGVVGGSAFLLGFLTWAAAGRDFPFPVSQQLQGTLALATPLVLGALCGVLCERAGVVNVSIEGQFLTAAFTSAVVGSLTGSLVAALLAAVAGGLAMAALLALFAIRYKVDQVVLGVVINLLAVGLTGFIFDERVQPASAELNRAPRLEDIPIPVLSDLPFVGPVLFTQNALAYLAVASVVLVWFLIFRTSWGLRVRSVGEHPEAADTVGISVRGIRWAAVLVGGVFGGLGGAFFSLAATGSFNKEMTVGTGFIALAALIMGRWHPVWATVMALFFGFVTQMASQLQSLSTPVPSQFLLLLPYVATIIAVAGLIGRVRAPAADGVPFDKP